MNAPPRCYFIGLVRTGTQKTNFTWKQIPDSSDDTTNNPSGMMTWKLGEPDFKNALEYCVCVRDYDGKAMDTKCNTPKLYLCQLKGDLLLKLCLSDLIRSYALYKKEGEV